MILMNDFRKEYQLLGGEVDRVVKKSFESGWYILGKSVEQFEKNFAKYIGVKYCVGVGNGMEALQISLMALGIGKGDEVITVSNTAVATALAISNTGAKPVFVDIDEYYHLNLDEVEKKITAKTKAIVPVHLFGQMVDMDKLLRIAKKNNLKIVEDACQAHGASFKGKKAGSFGDLGSFSFYPTKNLGAYGDGGAITTNSKELYEKCLMLRNYGQTGRYEHLIKGLNSRLDEVQASILNLKLKKLGKYIKSRQKIAKLYKKHLEGVSQIKLPEIRENSEHSFHLFVIEADRRDELQKFLKDEGVQSLIHYPIPIHKQECFISEYMNLELLETGKAAKRILSLPVHPLMTIDEVKKVCSLIKEFYGK